MRGIIVIVLILFISETDDDPATDTASDGTTGDGAKSNMPSTRKLTSQGKHSGDGTKDNTPSTSELTSEGKNI